MKELKQDEVKKISDFCIDHGVFCYDLQVEIVDHISSIIEQKLDTEKATTFEEAFAQIPIEFSKKTLQKIIKEKEYFIAANSKKIQLEFLKSYFTYPKILLIIGYILFVYFTINYLPYKWPLYMAIIIYIPTFIVNLVATQTFYDKENYLLRDHFQLGQNQHIQLKKLLLFGKKNNAQYLLKIAFVLSNLLVCSTAISHISNKTLSTIILFLLAGFGWVSYLAFSHQKKRLIEYAVKNYPEAFEIIQY